jgi:hypothetical protein
MVCEAVLQTAMSVSKASLQEGKMKPKPDLMFMLYLALGAGLLISSVAQSGLL